MHRRPPAPHPDHQHEHDNYGHRLPWPDAFAAQLVVCAAAWIGATFGVWWAW